MFNVHQWIALGNEEYEQEQGEYALFVKRDSFNQEEYFELTKNGIVLMWGIEEVSWSSQFIVHRVNELLKNTDNY